MLSCGIGQSHAPTKKQQPKIEIWAGSMYMQTQLQKGHVKNLEKALCTAIYFPLLPMWRENKHVASMLLLSWCGAYHIKSVLRWLPLGDHHSTCENINMKFSVLRSCAPIHHMIMTIPWPWPPYHHHHDFNHLYPPQLQNRRNIFRTSTETIYHPIFTLTLAITKGHHNGVTGRRQGIRQAGGGQPLRSMMEMMFGWQGLFED